MGPSRWREMAAAMQQHLNERGEQIGTAAEGVGLLAQAGGMALGDAYDDLTLPQRPYDAIMSGAAPKETPPEMLEAMYMRSSPGLEMAAAPSMGMTPQELGIGPSPEWLAASDAQLAEMDEMVNQRAFQKAMQKAAMKAKRQQYSDEYGTPEAARERDRLAREHWAKQNGS